MGRQGRRVAASLFEGLLPTVEGSAGHPEGIHCSLQAVLFEKPKNLQSVLSIFRSHLPKVPQARYPVKPPDPVPDVLNELWSRLVYEHLLR